MPQMVRTAGIPGDAARTLLDITARWHPHFDISARKDDAPVMVIAQVQEGCSVHWHEGAPALLGFASIDELTLTLAAFRRR